MSVIADVPLEPFSDAEARQFLGSRNIHDENAIRAILSLSGRLPMWLETLAAARPADAAREQMYHLICASPDANLPPALASAVQAAARSPIRARQWAELIADAGRDTGHDGLRRWGQRLHEGIRDDDVTQYLTDLIHDGSLLPDVMSIALDKRAECHWLMGRREEALADLDRAIKLSPRNGALIGGRGFLYQIMGRYDEALTDLTLANELSPDNAPIIYLRGRACHLLGGTRRRWLTLPAPSSLTPVTVITSLSGLRSSN